MQIVATIAEYNPLHTGHLFQIEDIKNNLHPQHFVVCMSGNFTQRGDIAICEKHQRALWAIKSGADIVLELPSFYAVNCAEKFSEGAIKTLSCFNQHLTIAFGSELGDIEKLKELSYSTHNETDTQKQQIKSALKDGQSLVKARAEILDIDNNLTPNNILGIEYIYQAQKYGFDTYTTKRENSYNGGDINDNFLSANAIRDYIFNNKINEISKFLPEYVQNSLSNCTFNNDMSQMLSYALSTKTCDYLKNIYEVSEGLENRILKCSKQTFLYDDLINNVKSKRYTMARIKRIMLYTLFNLTKDKAKSLLSTPPYARVLAVKRGNEQLLNMLSDNLITRERDLSCMPQSIKDAINYENMVDKIYFAIKQETSSFNTLFVD